MRRTSHVLKRAAFGLLAASFLHSSAIAQTPAPETATTASADANSGAVIVVAINGAQRLQLTSKKAIRSVINEKDAVARIQPLATEQNAVMVLGLTAGSSKITLTDIDGKTESFDVLVQLDVDAVKTVIKHAFPTANVTPIPAGTNRIVLTGNVAHPEDIETILRIAQGVVGGEVYNAMNVGGVRQVQLDVTIARVNRTEARRRNTNIIADGNTVSFGSLLPGLLQQGSSPPTTGGTGPGVLNVRAPATPLLSTGTVGTNMVVGIVPANVNVLMQALRTEGLAKLLAEPKLVTMSGHPAVFQAGGQQAVIGPSSGITGPGVVFQDVGTTLNFLPIVLDNGKIFLEVNPEVRGRDDANGISTSTGFVPGFSVQRVSTRVTMEAGQTFAIGGLIQTETSSTTNKVPFLGDLPFIGAAFSSISYEDREEELVILVTPYLVDPMDCKQAPCKLPGTETRKPDDFELFLETILEAPRGQRDVFQGRHYVPAWKNDPTTADKLPCGGGKCAGGCPSGNCGTGGCASGHCNAAQSGTVTPVTITVSSPPASH